MKKAVWGVVLFAAAVCAHAQTLSWNIAFYKGKERETLSISRTIRMKTGETFRIAIRPENDCYCYVVCYDSERAVYVLQNTFLKAGSEISTDPIEITDPPGTETIYVIMSLKRQEQLDSLIQKYNNNANSRQDANNLYREVVSLQNTASGLGEPASSFIASGGTTRGASGEYATRFTGKGMYVRAIAISH